MTTPIDQGPARELITSLRAQIEVSPPPLESVVRRSQSRRRAQRGLTWAAAGIVAVALTVVGVFAVRDHDTPVVTPTKSIVDLPGGPTEHCTCPDTTSRSRA